MLFAFLSTPSARRATRSRRDCGNFLGISIHALREEGDAQGIVRSLENLAISIHALREEGDLHRRPRHPARRDFYPRPPRGGRHAIYGGLTADQKFLSTPSARRATWKVWPPTPGIWKFLSTPSARRATRRHSLFGTFGAISIHALREEGDPDVPLHLGRKGYFYPRPPRGGRLCLDVY